LPPRENNAIEFPFVITHNPPANFNMDENHECSRSRVESL